MDLLILLQPVIVNVLIVQAVWCVAAAIALTGFQPPRLVEGFTKNIQGGREGASGGRRPRHHRATSASVHKPQLLAVGDDASTAGSG